MTYLNDKGKPITVVMLGGGATGKSSITVQLVSGHFLSIYDPTIEDSYRTSILIDGEQVVFEIIDTAGQEEYIALRDSYIRQGDAYVCVCSLISKISLIELNTYLDQIKNINDVENFDEIAVVIAANKCDLKEQIEIPDADLEALSNDKKIEYIKTSAKTKVNINLLYETVLKRYIRIQQEKNKIIENGRVRVIDNRRRRKRCNLF